MGNRPAGYWIYSSCHRDGRSRLRSESSPDPHKHAMAPYLDGRNRLLLIARFFFFQTETGIPLPDAQG